MSRFAVSVVVAFSVILGITVASRAAHADDKAKTAPAEPAPAAAPSVPAASVVKPAATPWIAIGTGRIDLGTGIVWRPSVTAPLPAARELPRTPASPISLGPIEGGAGITIRF